MSDRRDRIEAELERIALGGEASGRRAAARVTALRTLERLTRDDEKPPPEPEGLDQFDYPVDHRGLFHPGPVAFWTLRMNWRWEGGGRPELDAVREWERHGGRQAWEREGRPWPCSEWEADPAPWLEAVDVGAGR